MYLLTIFSFLVLLLIISLVVFPVRVMAKFNSEELSEYHVVITWLRPLFKATLSRDSEGFFLKVFLLGLRIMTNALGVKEVDYRKMLNLAREINPRIINLYASYGFIDPSITGMICGGINLLPEYIDLDILENHPNFFAYDDYFSVYLVAEVNIITAFLAMRKSSNKIFNARDLHYSR